MVRDLWYATCLKMVRDLWYATVTSHDTRPVVRDLPGNGTRPVVRDLRYATCLVVVRDLWYATLPDCTSTVQVEERERKRRLSGTPEHSKESQRGSK